MRRSIHIPTKKELIQGILWVAFVLFLLFGAAFLCSITAQNVTRKGNVFIQDSSKSPIKKDSATLTKYFYMASDGTKYPIYMSSTGKCFILRASAKTSKKYKQYLPEVTKQLSGK